MGPGSGDGTIIAFPTISRRPCQLSPRDREDVRCWQAQAKRCGYDRLVIHERSEEDAPEVGSFLSVYRRGEPWARFALTRRDGAIEAWCCVSGREWGRFKTVPEALLALLPGARQRVAASPAPPSPSAGILRLPLRPRP